MSHTLEQKITVPSVLRFTMPSIIMMVVLSLYTVVDGIFVSRLVNTDAFSAVNIVYPLLSVILALGTMFGSGTTAIVSRKMGEGKHREANEIVSFIILFTIILATVLSVFIYLFLGNIILLLGANEAIYDYCYAYAMPLVFFLPANILQTQFQALFIANGKPHVGLTITILGGLANVFLDYFFIAVCGMGISGAAIATGIGYSIPALYGLAYFKWHKKANLYFVKPKANWRVLLHASINGSSEMVSNLSGSITTLLFNIILMRLVGPDGVAAISILLYLDFVMIAISLGYSMGVAPLFSFNYGSGNKEKIRKLFKLSLGFCLVTGVLLTTGTFLFAGELAGTFVHRGTAVYDMAVTGLSVYAISSLFKGYNIFASSMFTAFGNGTISALLSFLRTLVFLVICLIGLAAAFGLDGVWYALPLAEILASVVAVICTVKYRKVYSYI